MSDLYILNGHDPVLEPDLMAWGRWIETANRRVAEDWIGEVRVSTIFLGLDHNWRGGAPLLFETMIFGGPCDRWGYRYSTWAEAERGHVRVLRALTERDDGSEGPDELDAFMSRKLAG